jgi:exopolysaccharide biosynthesis protein
MKHIVIIKVLLLNLLITISIASEGQVTGFNKIKWEKGKIAPGLVWKSSHTFLNDTMPQNISVLFVNLKKRKIGIEYDPAKNLPVSLQAAAAGALAAVNAGFFNIRDGGSVTYVRSNGIIEDTDTAKKWSRNSNMTGSLLISEGERVTIMGSMPNEWYDRHTEFEDVLVSGPLLLKNGIKVKLPETSLVITKHPRTAAGIKNSRKVVLLTIDGRTGESLGMSLPDLADLLILLGCRDGINLDGGGSTTMWISGKPFNGVVNMPCDNKKFDHLGERAVSDILTVK